MQPKQFRWPTQAHSAQRAEADQAPYLLSPIPQPFTLSL